MITHFDQVAVITGMKAWVNVRNVIDPTHHGNRIKDTTTIMSIVGKRKKEKKRCLTNPMAFHDKTLNNPGVEENFLNLVKCSYKKPTVNTTLDGERLRAFDKTRTSALIPSSQQ